MTPTITLTLSGLSEERAKACLAALSGEGPEEISATVTGKRASKKTAAPVEDEEMDFGSDDDDTDTEESEYSKEDVNKALKTYARKNGQEKAMKILKKFKVKGINDLDESAYGKVIEALEG